MFLQWVIPGFHEVDENCALLGCYAASSGNFLTMVWEPPVGPIFKGLSPNVGNKLPLLAA